MTHRYLLSLFCVLAILLPLSGKTKKREIRSVPTVVTSKTLDVDLAGNKAVLLGDVKVDDPKMQLNCQRMQLFFTEVINENGEKSSRKDLQRIECYENVKMLRKGDTPENRLRSTSGKAVYWANDESIILTESPVICRGTKTEIHGTRIILYQRSNRMTVVDGRVVTGELEQKKTATAETAPSPRAKTVPTVITSKDMEMDLDHGKAVLTGNVVVKDPQMNLNCRKMVLFFQESIGPDGKKTGRQDLQRIECYGDVKTLRHGKNGGTDQRSVSGKAIYLVKDTSVVLTEDPVIYNGDRTEVRGHKIVLYQNDKRMEVTDGTVQVAEKKSSPSGKAPKPAVITSDVMDMSEGRLTFLGNVKVHNEKMDLACRRMVVFLKNNAGQMDDESQQKNLEKIECYDDVVINRRNRPYGAEQQRAVAGKAVYLPGPATVTLTEKPVLYKGNNTRLHGTKITLYRDSNQVDVLEGKIITKETGNNGLAGPVQTGRNSAEKETVITSDTMMADMVGDRMLLMGKVKVDAPRGVITCRRMILFLQKAAGKQQPSTASDETSGKELQRVECYDNVEIDRRQLKKNAEKQRAVAGKAVYLVKDSTITLTEKPILYKGANSEIHATTIVLFTDSDRVEFTDGNIITKDLK